MWYNFKMTKLVHTYIADVLGLEMLPPVPLGAFSELPYFLNDAFEFSSARIGGSEVVLAQPKVGVGEGVTDVAKKIASVADKLSTVVVYCPEALASYERRNLIQSKTPFIVPGNQMYLPSLGMDLREHFIQKRAERLEKLSPSTQGMLIFALLNMPTQDEWSPGSIGAALGYAPMTVSRAIRELKHADLMDVVAVGRQKFLRKLFGPQETWLRALPFLRSPVAKTVHMPIEVLDQYAPQRHLAGYSALAQWSMLAAPNTEVYAVPKGVALPAMVDAWRDIGEREGMVDVQLWRYETGIVDKGLTVDPLSLWLSLRTDKDARVQIALEELMDKVRW